MRLCQHTTLQCENPHLKCEACPIGRVDTRETLVLAERAPKLPDPAPYVKFGSPSGAPGFGIEIGLKGTF